MLSRLVPAPLVRWFARPYVAGDTLEAGLDAARAAAAGGLRTTLDLLGEDVASAAQVDANVAVYEKTIDALARFGADEFRPSVSLKPSAFTTGDPEGVRGPIEALAARAHACGVALTIDMEGHRWTDLTLDLALDLFRRGFDVGTVLQTRLYRTVDDLRRIPRGMRLRLVIGIYRESARIAMVEKPAMKRAMLDAARFLLAREVHVEFATHDVGCIETFAREIAPRAPRRCEVQMLLGVPRTALQQRLVSGAYGVPLPVRLYVPFAIGWTDATAYLRRRMAESPNITWLVLRNLFSR